VHALAREQLGHCAERLRALGDGEEEPGADGSAGASESPAEPDG
jgi:hypothetical protein